MLLLAGQLLVGQIASVGEIDVALLPGFDADEGFPEFGTGCVVGADVKVALLVFLTFYGVALFVETLQVGDQHIALGQRPLDGLLGGVAGPHLLDLLVDLGIRHLVFEPVQLERVLTLKLDLGPDVDAGREGQTTVFHLVEGRDARGTGGHEARLLGGFVDQRRQQVLDDTVADGGAEALLDHLDRHFALAKTRNFEALLVTAHGRGHLPVDPLCRHLDLEITLPLALFDDVRIQYARSSLTREGMSCERGDSNPQALSGTGT